MEYFLISLWHARRPLFCLRVLSGGLPPRRGNGPEFRSGNEMQYLSDKNHAIMTVYVDDVTFSSEKKISNQFKQEIIAVVKKNRYRPSTAKTQSFSKAYPKVITGVVINKEGKPVVKNSLRKRIVEEYRQLLICPDNPKAVQRLRGLLTAARQVEPGIFPTIHKFAFPKDNKIIEKKKAP